MSSLNLDVPPGVQNVVLHIRTDEPEVALLREHLAQAEVRVLQVS